MTYRELLYKATKLIDHNQITLGEYGKMTKQLDREVEQEPILDKIKEIVDKWRSDTWTDNLSHECMAKIAELVDSQKSEDKE